MAAAATHRVVQISEIGGRDKLTLKNVPVPTLKEGEVLIKNTFAGVNFIDTYHR